MPALIKEPAVGLPSLPSNFEDSKPQLQYQGAEALIYRTTYPVIDSGDTSVVSARPAFLKYRPSKPYRHPILDAKLTRHRILAEARVLAKLRREGVAVPAIYALDWEAGWMLGEWIEGQTVRAALDWAVPLWLEPSSTTSSENEPTETVDGSIGQELFKLMAKIGTLVGKMHSAGVVHGDLTTSNVILRTAQTSEDGDSGRDSLASVRNIAGDVFLIDFGLVQQSIQDEDRGVDLYVLERAFGSSHPRTERLFQELLNSYEKSYKGARITLKKLNEVRMRGRKKIMIG